MPSKAKKKPAQITFSPSALRTYDFCQKKYYFTWLSVRKHGWVKDHTHPWYQLYELKRIKNRNTWVGNAYHHVVAYALMRAKLRRPVSTNFLRQFADDLLIKQFTFSQNKDFVGMIASHAPKYEGISTFLALFEHVYGLDDSNLLSEMRVKLDLWLTNTFKWNGWSFLLQHCRASSQDVHVEPNYLSYTLGDAKISARMDVGVELPGGKFLIYDWKCYSDNEDFRQFHEKTISRQLLTYALYPVKRTSNPLSLDNVQGRVFYPTTGQYMELRFNETDQWEFETQVDRWTRFQSRVFTEISEIDFEDLDGPYAPERSCPWCQFKAICQQEIEWHKLT